MSYQIHDIEQLTGIKAHTIRIWEKRYNLIAPHRTETNIRYYDDNQVRRLLNVSSLVNAGQKISHVSKLSDAELHKRIRELQLSEQNQEVENSYITALISTMLSFNEEEFAKLIDEIAARYGMQNTMLRFIYPFLVRVGVLWSTNDAMPAQEHFASNLLRRKLIVETAQLPPAPVHAPKALLFLPPDEWHEIGLLLTEFFARNAGYKTVYLGQCVPFDNVLKTIQSTRPSVVISFYILEKKKVNLPEGFVRLAKQLSGSELIVCGRAEMLEQIPPTENLQRSVDPEQMIALLNTKLT